MHRTDRAILIMSVIYCIAVGITMIMLSPL